MISKVVAVRDRAVDAFGTPFFVQALGQAIRSFEDEVNRDGSPFQAHPDDYDIYHIGDYDDSVGAIVPVTPVMLVTGKMSVKPKRSE